MEPFHTRHLNCNAKCILPCIIFKWQSNPGGSDSKVSAWNVEDLGWEDPLEKGTATHSSILAWRIPWSICNSTPLQYSCLENPMDGGAWKAAVHGVAEGQTRLSDFTFTFHFHALETEMATHSSVLAWRIPGKGEPGGLPSMESHRVGHDWSDLAAAAAAYSPWGRKESDTTEQLSLSL